MRPVVFNHPRGAKRGPSNPLKSKPKQCRSSLMYGAVLLVEEAGAEDRYESVDDTTRSRWQNQQESDVGFFADTENEVDTTTSVSASHDPLAHQISCMLWGASIEDATTPPNYDGNAVNAPDVECYGFADTNITIHLVNGEHITKRRAHTHPYIAALGLSRVILDSLDKDLHWNVVAFETVLLAEAKRLFSPETQKRWVEKRLRERVGEMSDVAMQDT